MSNETFATRPKCVVSLLFVGCPGTPIVPRYLPSCVNLRMCESGPWLIDGMPPPLPPIHTLPLLSIETPWFDDGHTYSLPGGGPPHAATTLPAGSNSMTGG